MGAAREAVPERGLGPGGAVGHGRDLAALGLGELEGLLEGVLVKGRDDPLDAGLVDVLAVGSDLDDRRRVRDAGHTDNTVHGLPPWLDLANTE